MTQTSRLFTAPYCAFSSADDVALTGLAQRVARPGARFLEVGSWLGTGSTLALARVARACGGRVYCVDTWRGSPSVSRHQAIAAQYDAFATFRANLARVGLSDVVCPLVMTSADAAAVIGDAVCDLVFIDGDHAYTSTLRDLSLWARVVRPGGVFCGHDCELRATPDVRAALTDVREQDHLDTPHGPFACVHPGVVLAVADYFQGQASLCAEHPDPQQRSTIWVAPEPDATTATA